MDLPIKTRDAWVETPQGQLFTRTWDAHGEGADLREDTPIVLFHDSLGSVELWRSFPEALCITTGRSVVAYDRLGFGRSTPFSGEWTTNFIHVEAPNFFPALREQLGIQDFIAMGHSVGGAMAALCAAAFPSACRALVTESAQAFVEDRTIQGIREAKAAFQQEGQLDRLKKYHGDKARWVLDAWTVTWLSPEFQSWNLDADLSEVVCPALIIHGEQDEYGSVAHPMRLAKAMAGETQVEILPGRRHVPHKEAEGLIVELIRSFLERVVR
ncbi:alpha/beta hydrolase [bacterium]|nr:alpha/beta hydrolase [bacterium]